MRSGATGTLPVRVTASLTGLRANGRDTVEVVMLPAAAARIELVQPVSKLLVGQQVQLAGRVYSIHGEPRNNAIVWRASSPSATIVDGKLTVRDRAGHGDRHGRAASTRFDVEVIAANVRSLRLTPSSGTGANG